MTVGRLAVGLTTAALLLSCGGVGTGEQVCGTVGASTLAEVTDELVPPAGYAYVDVNDAAAGGMGLGSTALASAEAFQRYANHDLPRVLTGLAVRYVLAGSTRAGAVRTVCSSTPIVLRVFQVNPEVAHALEFWKFEIAWFGDTLFDETDLVYAHQSVARANVTLNGRRGHRYVWLHHGDLYWAYGQDAQATTTFVEAVLSEEQP